MHRIIKDSRIKKILENSRIMCEYLGQKKGHGVEFELSPIYTAEELNDELHSMNCDAPNLFVFYKDGKINIEFEHNAIRVPYDFKHCLDCGISQKCPRYEWHKIDKTFKDSN